jgi:hypothetical protein
VGLRKKYCVFNPDSMTTEEKKYKLYHHNADNNSICGNMQEAA